LTENELEEALRAVGPERYHHLHPYHQRLHSGGCDKREVRAWAINRFAYQAAIPRKDAIVLVRLEQPEMRRIWRRRIEDHDGTDEKPGGIEKWLRLTDALDVPRDFVLSGRGVLPGTRFAVEAYLHTVACGSVLEAIASSLTEMFSPAIIGERVAGMLKHYDFIDRAALTYFEARPSQASHDVENALAYVKAHATTPELQVAAIGALRRKCDILWAMLDALEHAYVSPGRLPPGVEEPA
jgi:pyrroloquinoline quinone biosynthesis protein D